MCLEVQPNFIINILQFRITDHPLYITFAAFIFCLTASSRYNGRRVKELILYNALLSLTEYNRWCEIICNTVQLFTREKQVTA